MQLTIKQKRYITAFNILVPLLIGMAVDLYVPSLPHIAAGFHVGKDLVQLTIGLYMLGYGAGQFFLGILTDTYGRRRIFLMSVLFFTVVSFLAAVSPNIYILNLCRLLQGLGVAGMAVSRTALATDCFSGIELTKTLMLISMCWALGPIVGPYIGGYLQHYFNWRMDFYFFGAYGVVILLFTFFTLPETNLNKQPLHVKSIARSIKTMCTEPAFILGAIMLSLLYAMLVIFNTIGPFLIQEALKYSALAYGKIALFMGCGYFLGNLLSRQMIRYLDPLQVALIGLFSAILSATVLVVLAIIIPMNLWIIIIPTFFLFLSYGMIFSNVMSKCIALFPKNAGTACALYGMIGAGGVFLITLFATTLKANTQWPMAITYLIITLICFVLFFVIRRELDAKKQPLGK